MGKPNGQTGKLKRKLSTERIELDKKGRRVIHSVVSRPLNHLYSMRTCRGTHWFLQLDYRYLSLTLLAPALLRETFMAASLPCLINK